MKEKEEELERKLRELAESAEKDKGKIVSQLEAEKATMLEHIRQA